MLETKKEFYDNLSKCAKDTDKFTGLRITIITICGSLGSPIDLSKFHNFCGKNYENFELKYVPNTKGYKKTEETAFYNCLSLRFNYTDKGGITNKIAAKIFPNGSIQIPGCKTIEAVYESPLVIYNFVKKISEKIDILKNPDDFRLGNTKIAMINGNFSFSNNVYQNKLKELINSKKFKGNIDENKWRIASWQPEGYPGVNAKYLTTRCRESIADEVIKNGIIPTKVDGQVSVFIFRSGKCTISGAKNTSDLLETYKVITKLAYDNPEIFMNKA